MRSVCTISRSNKKVRCELSSALPLRCLTYLVTVGGVSGAEAGERAAVVVVLVEGVVEILGRALRRGALARLRGRFGQRQRGAGEVRLLDHLAQLLHPDLLRLEVGRLEDDAIVGLHRRSARPDGELALVALDVLGDAQLGGHHFVLEVVLDGAVRVFDLLREQQIQLEEEDAPLAPFADDLLVVPGEERVLHHHLAEVVDGNVALLQQRQMHRVVRLLRHVQHHLEPLLRIGGRK